jgi:hypothetical protein
MTRLMNEVWGEPEPEESTLAKLEGEIKLFFAQHKHVRQVILAPKHWVGHVCE